jgi:hypothetical protein
LVTGVNLVGWAPKTITLNGTAANLVVNIGDVLELQSVHTGTGITDPGGQWEVVVTRTA